MQLRLKFKTHTITVRCSEEEKVRIQRLSAREGRPVSNFILNVVKEYEVRHPLPISVENIKGENT